MPGSSFQPPSINPDNSPLAALSSNSQYSSNSFTYPLNLNAPDAGLDHYILFHINQNNSTQYSTAQVNGQAPQDPATVNQNIQSQVSQQGKYGTGTNAQITQNVSRVSTTIAIYMPNQISANYSANWAQGTLDATSGLVAGNSRSWTNMRNDYGISIAQNLGNTLADLNFDIAGSFEFAAKFAVLDHTEVLFGGVNFREFEFEFMFVPQSQAEATNVQNIIQAFKFYWAPEVVAGSAGRFWLYPSEFDIQYIAGGAQNQWLNQISTCALTDISVDYTPGGVWAAHRLNTSGNNNVAPGVSTRLRLKFKELELLQKSLILKNY